MSYKIEKGIRMPLHIRQTKYPFANMEVEDSFYIPLKDDQDIKKLTNIIRTAYGQFCKNHNKDWKFKTLQTGKGVRIWRVK